MLGLMRLLAILEEDIAVPRLPPGCQVLKIVLWHRSTGSTVIEKNLAARPRLNHVCYLGTFAQNTCMDVKWVLLV
jgi:hypothetical protein